MTTSTACRAAVYLEQRRRCIIQTPRRTRKSGAKHTEQIALFRELWSKTCRYGETTSTLVSLRGTDLAKDVRRIEFHRACSLFNDAWQRFVGNMGVDRGRQGMVEKYLALHRLTPQDPRLLSAETQTVNRNSVSARLGLPRGGASVENITSGLKIYPLKMR